jgi:hypothetical protein
MAWLAFVPGYDRIRGDEVTNQVPQAVADVCRRLLSVSGNEVLTPFGTSENMCRLCADRGAVIPFKKVKVRIAQGHDSCYSCAAIWLQNKATHQIAAGYVLMNNEQMWYPHMWLVAEDGVVIDTICKRDLYFGVVFPQEAAECLAEMTGALAATLAPSVLNDPNAFRQLCTEKRFTGQTQQKADEILAKCRVIKPPVAQDGAPRAIEYHLDPKTGKFSKLAAVPATNPLNADPNVRRKDVIDLLFAFNVNPTDKNGGKRLVAEAKELLFGSSTYRVTTARSNKFFENDAHFVLPVKDETVAGPGQADAKADVESAPPEGE